ncbi:MAG TPA: serine/threonine-protein kinase [Kofleriaceae bacterium]|nr:serine/threonine-protein kinase [Kofleriaceae bacterium]
MAEPFGPYWLEQTINVGSIGEVFLARRTDGEPEQRRWRRARRASRAIARVPRDGGPVVVKRLHRELARRPAHVQLFLEEGRMARRFTHDNLVHAFDAGTVDHDHYIAMDLVRGPNLAQLIQRGPIAPRAALRIAADLLRGLAHMHERGVVHCDVSPTNVLVGRERVELADFGVTNPVGEPQPQVRGTIAYMSPEQARGLAVDGRSDVFAVGAIVWELLARRPLFARAAPHLSLAAVVEEPVPDPAEVSGADPALATLAPALAGALAKDPAERLLSCAELAAALAAAAGDLSS